MSLNWFSFDEMNLSHFSNKRLLFLWTLGLGLTYLATSLYFQVDYPANNDDVVIEIEQFNDYLQGDITAVKYFFGRKNHPNIIHRIHVFIVYHVYGHVSFSGIRVLANIIYTLFIFYFIYYFRNNTFAFALPLLFFTPTAAMIYWGSVVTSYPYPYLLLFLILILLPGIKNIAKIFLLAMAFPLLAFSFSNGSIALLLIFLFLTYLVVFNKISKKTAFFFMALTMVCLYLSVSGPTSGLNHPMEVSWRALLFPFAFCGSLAKYAYERGQFQCILLFIILGLLAGYAIIKKRKSTDNVVLLLCILTVFLSGVGAGLARCQSPTFCTPTAARYEIMGVFAIVFCLLAIDKYARRTQTVIMVILFSLCTVKYVKNINKLQSIQYINEYRKAQAHFTGKIMTSGIRQQIRNNSKRIMQLGIEKNLVKLGPYKSSLIDYSEARICGSLKKVQFNSIAFGKKDNLSFLRGTLKNQRKKNYYIKYQDTCIPVVLKFNPSQTEGRHFYAFLPPLDKKDVLLLN